MLLMKHPAVKSAKTGAGILVVGTGAGVSMAVAGKTILEDTLTGNSLIPMGFMIAWMCFIGGLWSLIMSLNVSPLNLKVSRNQFVLLSVALVACLYVIGGFVHSITILTTWLIGLTILSAISIYIWTLPRRVGDSTWAAAIFGALASFTMMAFIYAIIPHEWITFATSYLGWTKDVKLSTGGEFVLQTWLNGNIWTKQTRVAPFEINLEMIQDNATMAIYVITAVINVKLFAAWQKRNEPVAAKSQDADEDSATSKLSRFGQPIKSLKNSKATV